VGRGVLLGDAVGDGVLVGKAVGDGVLLGKAVGDGVLLGKAVGDDVAVGNAVLVGSAVGNAVSVAVGSVAGSSQTRVVRLNARDVPFSAMNATCSPITCVIVIAPVGVGGL